ncbi:MAG: ACP S-malonyltransferase [Pseudomonadales bacterium]
MATEHSPGPRRPTAVVIAPGRGTYNTSELGYLSKYHGDKSDFLDSIDQFRAGLERESVRALDGSEKFSLSRHTRGSNAAGLIYACALADFQDIGDFDIVAITGNSMGWYLALAAGGCLDWRGTGPGSGIELTETMAGLMDAEGVGGQLLYPLVDSDWQPAPARVAAVNSVLAQMPELQVSIRMGGSVVLAGPDAVLRAAMQVLPEVEGRFPLRLANHAAFHTALLAPVSARAFEVLPVNHLQPPRVPLIDGRGAIWQSWCDLDALRRYTLGTQVTERYDFTHAIEVALKEFAPDRLILLGPGSTLGAPVLQTLTAQRWLGLDSKARWQERQAQDPFLLAMGIEAQRTLATRTGC